ncbi:hypothetical protein FXF52_06580 [Micromonospora sp. MP36]|nr:hypothetical protein FXF52_06580 [Micromonospora sp. MP36]
MSSYRDPTRRGDGHPSEQEIDPTGAGRGPVGGSPAGHPVPGPVPEPEPEPPGPGPAPRGGRRPGVVDRQSCGMASAATSSRWSRSVRSSSWR